MAKYVNVESGNYTVTVADGGIIKLDTGSNGANPGKVIVTGNLEIQGETTTVYTNDLVIDDNIIYLNRVVTTDGSNGVRLQSDITSGLEVDLGYTEDGNTGNFLPLPKAQWVYDGSIIFKNPQNTTDPFDRGAWVPRLENGSMLGVQTVSITAPQGSDLNLLGVVSDGAGGFIPHTGHLTVAGTDDYAGAIGNLDLAIVDSSIQPNPTTDEVRKLNYLPNVEWVLEQIAYTLTQTRQPRIQEGTFGEAETFVETQDDTVSGTSQVIVGIDGVVTTTFKDTTSRFFDVTISDNTIYSSVQDENLVLYGKRYGSVEVNDSLVLTHTSQHVDGLADPSDAVIDPVAPSNAGITGIKVYTKPEEPGGTGIFFVNDELTRDELVSKNKAILYSMIF